ncbi:diacylglycerol/lipid kinase family protein [Actinomadura madurae]|uniref:diacylglycerol/lipid kinase family protein n=1 Tax=Actinomadura madurae TaxID=1993 RepID=UPI0020D20A0F|nr:acylglycerol kinase family protein [Actinomadura madurae]MCP9968142.1 acylglycerol kinase family protein [Actinomadura madurae]MCP9980602.1 acylglycerol kinase family protein [Actinomadura madurae]
MLLFTNANAGTHDAETVEKVAGLLRDAGRDVTVCPSASSGDLDQALDGDRDAVAVAAGGDGSINRLVGALYRRGELDRTVGLVPMGTGNDLARNLGVPLDPEDAARLLLDGGRRELDLIVDEDGRATLNAVHAGIGAAAAASATRFKSRMKAAAFPLGATLAGMRHSGWRLKVEADGEPVAEGKFLMVALSNASGIAGRYGPARRGRPPRGRQARTGRLGSHRTLRAGRLRPAPAAGNPPVQGRRPAQHGVQRHPQRRGLPDQQRRRGVRPLHEAHVDPAPEGVAPDRPARRRLKPARHPRTSRSQSGCG